MLAMIFINPAYWIVAFALTVAWAWFGTWVGRDAPSLRRQREFLWNWVMVGSLALLLLFWVLIPNFWLALLVNLAVMAGVVAWYWHVRVAELGPSGHLLAAVFASLGRVAETREIKKSAEQLILEYITDGGAPQRLPATDDPLYGGVVLADQLLVQAMESRAQLIELSPSSQAYELRFSVDGVVFPQPAMQRSAAEPIIQGVKRIAGLSLEERRRPQKGGIIVRDGAGQRTVWTVETSGTTAGEKVHLQAGASQSWRLALSELGMTAEQLGMVKQLASLPAGVVLATAPAHMGRTTLLYSLLTTHDAYTNSIQTVESNPRCEFESVTVNKIDPQNPESSAAKILSNLLLKDPNVVLLGLCTDAPSADGIARFGQDRKAYVGLLAGDTLAALDQWRKLVGNSDVAAQSLQAVIASRLVRILCPACKTGYTPDADTLARLNLPLGREIKAFKANTQPMVDPKGNPVKCGECGGIGYKGRTGIYEILVINDDIRKALTSNKTIDEIRTLARKNHLMLLVEHGIRKFAAGVTSIQEVLRVCSPEKATRGSAAPARSQRSS